MAAVAGLLLSACSAPAPRGPGSLEELPLLSFGTTPLLEEAGPGSYPAEVRLVARDDDEQPAASAADTASELAKKSQNPVADIVSVPSQLNSGFDTGTRNNTQHTLNIQPVYPQHLDEDWNWIHRTIIPVIHQPSFTPGSGSTSGLGNVTYQGFLSPAKPDGAIWGVGPAIAAPTAHDERLGAEEWAAGPAFVVLKMSGPWVSGALLSHVWGLESGAATDFTTFQPFLNYNFDKGWYLTASPILTGNWNAADSGDIWTVPVGGGGGRTFHLGKQPVNVNMQVFKNIHRPAEGSGWSTRVQFTLMFPKGK